MSLSSLVQVTHRKAAGNLAAQSAALLSLSLASVLVARAGGAAVVGDYAVLRVLPWLCGVVMSCGLPLASAYYLAADEHRDVKLRPTLAVLLVVGSALAALTWCAATPLLRHLLLRDLPVPLVLIMSLAVVTQLVTVTMKAWCQGVEDLAGANLIIVAEEFLFLPAYVVVLAVGPSGVQGVLVAMLLAGAGAAATGVIRVHRRGLLAGWAQWPSAGLAHRILVYGAKGQVGNLLWLLNLRFDFILVGAMAGPASLGVYAVASKFAELLRLAPTALNYVLYPRFAASSHDDAAADARRIFPRAMIFTLAAAPALALLSAVGLPLIYGAAFASAVTPACVLAVGLSVEGGAAVASAYLCGTGRPGLNSWGMAAGVVVTVVLDFALIPGHAAVGAAVASSMAYLTTTALLTVFLRTTAVDRGRPATDQFDR